MSETNETLRINLEKVLRKQKLWILRKMPIFLIRILEKIIHQNQINDILLKLKDKKGKDFVDGVCDYFNWKLDVEGIENLPEHNHLIFTLNHSMGAPEGAVALSFLLERYPNTKALANNVLWNIKNARPILLPVNVFGKTAREDMSNIAAEYESDTNIFTFPAGKVSRINKKNQVRDREWHPSFVENSTQYKRKVVPIYCSNINTKRFYRIYRLRNFLGIKSAIELFLLPNEMFRGRGQTIHLKIGKAIPHTTFTNKYTTHEWAQKIRKHIYKFEKNHQVEFSE